MKRILLIIGFISFYTISFAQDYNAELVLQETNIAVNNNKLTMDVCYEIKINNRSGEKYTKIIIPYSKLIKVGSIKAYIKDSNGRTVKKLKNSEIIEKSSISGFSFYEDDYIKEFTLKHNTYPYTIVYSYQVQQNEYLNIDYWVPVIDEKIPTLSASLKVTVPITFHIAYLNQNVKGPVIDTAGNEINYKWHASYTDIIKPEVLPPPVLDLEPSVRIVPQEFTYDISGSLKDWVSFGDWQYALLKDLNELPDAEKSKIHMLVKDVDDVKEKIKILYHFLQDNTRYINITIETGGLKPYPAKYVALNKYGDCKALTNYFKSMLDYLEIKSYYTKVNAGIPIKEINQDFPSQQTNHVILYIPYKDEDIWLDCTSDGAFNYLGTFTQNRNAFIIDYNNSHFLKTPALSPPDVLETRKIEINYKLQEANVKFQNFYKGDMYENILDLDKNYNESEKSRIVSNYFIDNGFQLIDYKILRLHRDSAKIKLIYEATSRNIYNHYGNDILINNITFSIPRFEKPGQRKLPVQIDFPVYMIDTLVYEIPAGYNLNIDNDEYLVSNKYGKYKYIVYEEKGEIIVIKSLLINTGRYPVSDYEDFYNFYTQIIDIENKTNLILNKNF